MSLSHGILTEKNFHLGFWRLGGRRKLGSHVLLIVGVILVLLNDNSKWVTDIDVFYCKWSANIISLHLIRVTVILVAGCSIPSQWIFFFFLFKFRVRLEAGLNVSCKSNVESVSFSKLQYGKKKMWTFSIVQVWIRSNFLKNFGFHL